MAEALELVCVLALCGLASWLLWVVGGLSRRPLHRRRVRRRR